MDTGREQAERRWQQTCGGIDALAPTALDPTAAEEDRTRSRLRPHGRDSETGPEADEPGSFGSAHAAASIQRSLVQLKGQAKLRSLKASLQRDNRQVDLARLAELCNPEQCRSWLWSINKAVDPCLEPRLYSVAVRLMLGVDFVSGDSSCGGCGKKILDAQASHATCCHGAAVTIGHNRIRDVLAMGFAVSDPATTIEPAGLVPSNPALRPADILTRSARESGYAAVDVGVASPHAAYAGDDCLDSMLLRKKDHYGDAVLDELSAEGISYTPALISCYGRRSTTLSSLLHSAALRAARVRGLACGAAIEAR